MDALDETASEVEKSGIPVEIPPAEQKDTAKRVREAPNAALLDTWRELETVAADKLRALAELPLPRDPLLHLEHSGALNPSASRAIQDLRSMRNLVVHDADVRVSTEGALKFVSLAKTIAGQVKALAELPKQKLKVLTLLILEFNHLIDTGKYNEISIEDVHQAIETRNIIPFIAERTKGAGDFGMFGAEGPYVKDVEYFNEQMEQLYYGYAGKERRKWGVENSGLCLLVAWTNEIIQQGSGWYPDEWQ
jgi:hypothetical protein